MRARECLSHPWAVHRSRATDNIQRCQLWAQEQFEASEVTKRTSREDRKYIWSWTAIVTAINKEARHNFRILSLASTHSHFVISYPRPQAFNLKTASWSSLVSSKTLRFERMPCTKRPTQSRVSYLQNIIFFAYWHGYSTKEQVGVLALLYSGILPHPDMFGNLNKVKLCM